MRTKKSKTKNRKNRNRITRNRIKGGTYSNHTINTIETASNEDNIVSQMQEINIHLGEITNAIRACCNSNSNSNPVNETPHEQSTDTSYAPGNVL